MVLRPRTFTRRLKRGIIQTGWAFAGALLTVIMWELVKWLGTVVTLPLDTSDASMPNVWTMIAAFGDPEVRGSDTTVFQSVLSAVHSSLLIALCGFIIGVSIGLLLAVVMQRFSFLERGLLPFVIASQTVPLIALAPLMVGVGNRFSLGPIHWSTTTSVMFIAAYLAFFPLSVGALRGLHAPTATSLELMQSYSATPNQTLIGLRFPASVPYLVPAMKVYAAAAVVVTVVAEISAGVGAWQRSLDYLILQLNKRRTSEGVCSRIRRN